MLQDIAGWQTRAEENLVTTKSMHKATLLRLPRPTCALQLGAARRNE